jgi:Subtilase family
VNGPTKLMAPLIAALAVAACNGGTSSLPGLTGQPGVPGQVPDWQATHSASRVCNDARPGYMNCDVLINARQFSPDIVAGWAPKDFQTVYHLPSSSKGAGQIVAIVDAFDNPKVASDLAMYRKNFGLGTAKFSKFNQAGQKKNYPPKCSGSAIGWCLEIDLDAQMVSAACPKCTIWLFESADNSSNNLYAAVKEAVKLGAHIVSNSYGGGGGSASGGAFSHSGVTYLASAGDFGYGMQDPADYDTVVSVGGTVLAKTGTKYSETVWNSTGGGCSVVSKPSWQHDPKCSLRTGNDVAAVAYDVAEYDTFNYAGWITVQGTSIGSPLLGGVYALAGNASTRQSGKDFWTSTKRSTTLHTISSGSVLGCPSSLTGTYLCQAGTKQYKTYSGPTGWGTPNGVGAF